MIVTRRRWLPAVGLALVMWGSSAATAPAQQSMQCQVTGDKVVSPTRIRLGETVQVRLSLNAECPPNRYYRADIVLVIDRSRSMQNSGKLEAAKQAAKTFSATVNLQTDRIAVVAFHGQSEVVVEFSQDLSAIQAAIDGIGIESATDISLALRTAQDLLQTDGRDGALPVIVLITDGAPNRPPPDPHQAARDAAAAAKLAGTQIFTVGLGPDADATLLRQLASADTNYYYSPTPAELEEIYRTIAILVGTYVLSDVIVEDLLSSDVTMVPGTLMPGGTVIGQEILWSVGLMPPEGATWVYQVKPKRAGTYPTNQWAYATYTDADGERREYSFPLPKVTVIDPNVEQPCSGAAMWTITVQGFPDGVGVGGLEIQGCNNQFDGGDWVVGTAYRLPPLSFQLVAALSGEVIYSGTGVAGPGRVDQRLYIRTCQPPPYRLRLTNADLAGYKLCPNSPVERLITSRDFRPPGLNRTEVRYGFVR